MLRDPEVPKHTPDIEKDFPKIGCAHEFRLGRRLGNSRLKFSFVSDRSTSQSEAYSSEGTSLTGAGGPVEVNIPM